MKIFLVIANLAAGGAERVMSELANNWSEKKDLDIHIILLSDGEIFYNIDKSVTIHKLGLGVNQNKIVKIFSLISLVINFRTLVKTEKPDIILSFMNKYNIFTLLSTLGQKVKVIVSERDSSTEVLPRLTVLLRNFTYKFAKGIITQTLPSKEFITKETGNNNVITIPNPIKKIDLDPSLEKENIILNTGRLVEKKGQKYLLEAFAKIDLQDWLLVFLGDGSLRKDLEKYVISLGLHDKVKFIGTVSNVDHWLNRASIFAFPSLWEGFPNALAEAMSAGLPVVSFDCDTGPSELIVDGKNGYLVDLGDTDTLALKLEALMKNAELRKKISKEAVKVASELDSKKISDKYLSFLKETVSL